MARKNPPQAKLLKVRFTGRNVTSFPEAAVFIDETLRVEFDKKGQDGHRRLQKLAWQTTSDAQKGKILARASLR